MFEIEFQKVDARLLTKAESDKYAELTNPAGMNALSIGEQLCLHKATFVVVVAWLLASLAAFATSPMAGLVLVLIGGILVFVAANSIGTRALQKRVDDYLAEIGYAERVRAGRRAGPTSSDDDGYPSKSRRQMQHEWYEDHSELDWRDRERAEMYGMDVNTYINNVLENDKD